MENIIDQITQSVSGYVPKLIAGLIILVVGWILALVVSGGVRSVLRRSQLNRRLAAWVGEQEGEKPPDVARGVGRIVFWLIMILVLVALFQVFGLTLATESPNLLLSQVFEFIPKLLGAAVLLLIAWIVASVIRVAIMRALVETKLDERVARWGRADEDESPDESKRSVPLTRTISDAAYWLTFLLFLPAVVGALNLEGLLDPVRNMMDEFLSFLPNILAAVLIGVIGWFLARIVQRTVSNLVTAAGGDQLSERAKLAPLSTIAGLVVYIMILVPVLIASLNALALGAITRPASEMLNLILESLPHIFAATVLIAIAYVVGKLLAGFVADLLTGIGFNSLPARLGIGKESSEGRRTPSEIVGYLTMIAIILLATFEASSLLGFDALSDLMVELTVFGGHVLLALVIFGIGIYLANLAAKAIRAGKTSQANVLSIVAKVAILLLAGSIAVRHMGLANEIVNMAFGLILGSVAVATAIAFGIGGRDLAARKLQEWAGSKIGSASEAN